MVLVFYSLQYLLFSVPVFKDHVLNLYFFLSPLYSLGIIYILRSLFLTYIDEAKEKEHKYRREERKVLEKTRMAVAGKSR